MPQFRFWGVPVPEKPQFRFRRSLSSGSGGAPILVLGCPGSGSAPLPDLGCSGSGCALVPVAVVPTSGSRCALNFGSGLFRFREFPSSGPGLFRRCPSCSSGPFRFRGCPVPVPGVPSPRAVVGGRTDGRPAVSGLVLTLFYCHCSHLCDGFCHCWLAADPNAPPSTPQCMVGIRVCILVRHVCTPPHPQNPTAITAAVRGGLGRSSDLPPDPSPPRGQRRSLGGFGFGGEPSAPSRAGPGWGWQGWTPPLLMDSAPKSPPCI